MLDEQPTLEPAVEALVAPRLLPNECLNGWCSLPTDDVVVLLIDRDLQKVVAPFVDKDGPRLGSGRTLVFARESGCWVQVATGNWGFGKSNLLQMFQVADKKQPGVGWGRGVEACFRWMELSTNQATSQAVIDALLAEFDCDPSPLWREARRQLAMWARHHMANEALSSEALFE